MPPVHLTEVVDVSSQDEKHPASNIITKSGKWLCSPDCKERSMEATFVFDKPYVITSLDIGNSGSAHISILVSNSISEGFKALLPLTTFMTAAESKIRTRKGQVNFFNIKDHFMPDTREQKWTKIKVICEQPFNTYQFGLNFLNLSSMPDATKESSRVSGKISSFVEMADEATSNEDESSWKDFKAKYQGPKIVNMRHPAMRNGLSAFSNVKKPRTLTDYYEKDEKTIRTTAELCNTEQGFEDAVEIFEASSASFIDTLDLKLSDLEALTAKDILKKFQDIYSDKLGLDEQGKFYRLLSRHVKKLKQTAAEELSKSSDEPRISGESNEDSQARCLNSKQTCEDNVTEDSLSEAVRLNSELNTNPSVRRNKLSLVDTGPGESNSDTALPVVSKFIYSPSRSLKRNSDLINEDVSPPKIVILDHNQPTHPVSEDDNNLVECPLCKVYLEQSEIEAHSADCASPETLSGEYKVCPICKQRVPGDLIAAHADTCAQSMFGD